jgi:hypothetical protein
MGEISVKEFSRIISRLRHMLHNYESEAEFLSLDVLEGHKNTSVSNDVKKNVLESRTRTLEGDIQEHCRQKKELEDSYQRLQGKNLELEADSRSTLAPSGKHSMSWKFSQ